MCLPILPGQGKAVLSIANAYDSRIGLLQNFVSKKKYTSQRMLKPVINIQPFVGNFFKKSNKHQIIENPMQQWTPFLGGEKRPSKG
jgi:hypothetical protein